MGKPRVKYVTAKTGGGMTHAEIGAVLGVSSQRVHQIETAAFRKIREQFPELRLFCHNQGKESVFPATV